MRSIEIHTICVVLKMHSTNINICDSYLGQHRPWIYGFKTLDNADKETSTRPMDTSPRSFGRKTPFKRYLFPSTDKSWPLQERPCSSQHDMWKRSHSTFSFLLLIMTCGLSQTPHSPSFSASEIIISFVYFAYHRINMQFSMLLINGSFKCFYVCLEIFNIQLQNTYLLNICLRL